MSRLLLSLVLAGTAGISVALLSLQAAEAQQQSPSSLGSALGHAATIRTYCVTCHNERLRTAGLRLDGVDLSDVSKNAEVWEKVAHKLRTGAMPPVGMPRPEPAAARALVSWVESQLDRAAAARPNPGRTEAFHRLTRAEYRNVSRDLLGLDVDVSRLLPSDDASFGFDNIADLLSVSPALFDRYMSAARRLSRLAVGLPPRAPVVEVYVIPDGVRQDDAVNHLGDDLPFGSRGGAAMRHHFPADGTYVLKVSLGRNHYDYIQGLGASHQVEIRIDRALIRRFTVGGGDAMRGSAPTGFLAVVLGSPEFEEYAQNADAHLEVRVPVKAGNRVISVSFVAKWTEAEGVVQPPAGSYSEPDDEIFSNPTIRSLSISGPYEAEMARETLSRHKIFVCHPQSKSEQEPCAMRILGTLARRAYRGFATDKDTQALLSFYRDGLREGSFETGIQLALQRLLVDPRFLFRIERDPADLAPGAVYRVSGLELASRLSFFLWSSIPDDELLDVAARGRLRDAAVLERQVRRMLADNRARALVDNFAGQWLELRNLDSVSPDSRLFPDFDDNLRQAFRQETELFIQSQLREDRSVLDVLRADYTFLNERLARHYDIPHVFGAAFRRVTLPNGQRGGLLGHGSILTLTSPPNRTSPVFRGKWILDNILGSPPPPPPPNVPNLPEKSEGETEVSVRERLEQHRRNPVCASCHAPMDPLGFALEHFDPVGRWRSTEAGKAVDASGVMPHGAKFEGIAGLRAALLAQPERFAGTVTEKLLVYAVGRAFQHYDYPTVRTILRAAAPSDYRWSAIIMGIVKSAPFQMRTVLAPDHVMVH